MTTKCTLQAGFPLFITLGSLEGSKFHVRGAKAVSAAADESDESASRLIQWTISLANARQEMDSPSAPITLQYF
jgi:hypothetical protein